MRCRTFQLASFFVLFAVLFLNAHTILAADGDLDPTFGQNGWIYAEDVPAQGIAVQSDKKIILAGGFRVARYNPNGTLDQTFGQVGYAFLSSFAYPLSIRAVALQSNGKIVVAGSCQSFSGVPNDNADFFVARLNKNGTFDTTFDGDGFVATNFPLLLPPYMNNSDKAEALEIQPDGKIIAVGISTEYSSRSIAIARYNPNGRLDTSFGANGLLKGYPQNAYIDVADAALQPDGKLLVAGQYGPSGLSGAMTVWRFSMSSTPDNFGYYGRREIYFSGSWNSAATAVGIQTDGKIVVAGSSYPGMLTFALARLLSDGTVDTSFGDGGLITTNFVEFTPEGRPAFSYIRDMLIQPDGKILVAGGANTDSGPTFQYNFALARYNSNGTLDTSFGVGGKVANNFAWDEVAHAIALQPDGKILAAGEQFLARYQNRINLTISSFRLTTIGGQVIRTLSNNAVLRASELVQYGELVIEAVTSPSITGSVHINADFDQHTENGAPYTTIPFTINRGDWQDLSFGQHRITATPYAGANKTGFKGTSRTINFTVTY